MLNFRPASRGRLLMRSSRPTLPVLAAILTPCIILSGAEGQEAGEAPAQAGAVRVVVEADPEGRLVSPYLVSANCHGLRRHTPDNEAWDAAMRRVFGGSLLMLLESARREPDENGDWWDFEAIDVFITRARDVWEVEELAFLPQWWIQGWTQEEEPTPEEFAHSSRALVQLVERYGRPGPLFVRYWMASDEWGGGKFWEANPDSFARHYAALVRQIKAVNPKLLVGGPVDPWPRARHIQALLRECPELDFIAWNLFITGSAETPLADLFRRTPVLGAQVERSREMAREILGRELPVMVSSYNMNFRAWDPPELRMAAPVGGAWNALALSSMARAGAFSAVMYNVLALDCGMFGPADGYAQRGGWQPQEPPAEGMLVRPLAFAHEFFRRNVAGTVNSRVEVTGADKEDLSVLATLGPDASHTVVMVNYAKAPRTVTLALRPFRRTASVDFRLPTEFLYCDTTGLRRGEGLFFSVDGKADFAMPPYSAWCLKTAPGSATPEP